MTTTLDVTTYTGRAAEGATRDAHHLGRLAQRALEPCARAVVLVMAMEAHEDAIEAWQEHAHAWPWLVRVRDLEAHVAEHEQALHALGLDLIEARVLIEIEAVRLEHARALGLPLPPTRVGLA